MKKILLNDGVFGTWYQQWRIQEIYSFINNQDTDIITFKMESFAGIDWNIQYEYMDGIYGLKDKYNILIFDKKYNYLNKYNKEIDGTKFNNKFPASYLFTKNDNFDLSKYDLVYHIFLSQFELFNKHFKFPMEKQVIRLYPGGGYNDIKTLQKIQKDVNIITTQRFITENVEKLEFKNYIEILGAPFLQKNNQVIEKTKNNGTLTVCFSSMGVDENKGTNIYHEVVDKYSKLYKKDDVKFISIGNCPSHPKIFRYSTQPMDILSDFYYDNVDIIINPETSKHHKNGWPLGVEGMLRGVVIINTDVNDQSKYFSYNNDVIISNNIDDIINNIKKLYENRELLNDLSIRIQHSTNEFYSYDNQQKKVFDFINNL